MNRRTFLAASSALFGQSLVPSPLLRAMASSASLPLPGTLLTNTFVPLAGSLLPANAWHPFPKAAEREPWTALPADVRTELLRLADKANSGEWPQMLATDELEFHRTGNRSHFESISFGRRERLGWLVFGECLTASGKYLDQIANGIWLICEESFWGAQAHLGAQKAGEGLADVSEPVIELFSAETAATLAWVVYLLEDKLNTVSPLLVPRIKMETKRRTLDPFLARNDFWWMGLSTNPKDDHRHLNNWNPWINSNVLTAALLLEPNGPRRQQIVAKVCRSVDRFLRDYSADGACEEGPGYWSRSAASFYDCCATLVSAHGGKGGAVLEHPFTRAMGHFICDVHIAKNEYVDYGDAHIHASPEAEMMYRFGKATGDRMLEDFGAFTAAGKVHFSQGSVASFSRELAKVFTVQELRTATGKDALPLESWYPALGFMSARQAEGSTAGFYVALQAASNGRPHGHNDSGSFLVFHNAEPIFIDPGVGQYTKQTFSKDRYKLWPMQSAFHNLPTIGALAEMQGQQRDGDAFRASDLRFESGHGRTEVAVNLATAYPKTAGITNWQRTVALDRNAKAIEVRERFSLAHAAPVTLTLMCAKQPALSDGRVRVGDVELAFDARVLQPVVQVMDLDDANMRSSWGSTLWRLTLTTMSPVSSGDWKLTLREA